MTYDPRCLALLCSFLIGLTFTVTLEPDLAYAEKRTKDARSKTAAYPVVVRDIRSWSTAQETRIVFDLTNPVTHAVKEPTPERVTVELTNTILSTSSRLRVSEGNVPRPLLVSQSQPRTVTIVLPRRQLSDYKIFTLSKPDRLVVDITHRPTKDMAASPGESTSSSPAVAEPPPPSAPVIPSPIVSEALAAPPTPKPAKIVKTIVIDPGHGGKDPGTIGHHGTTEKDVTLKLGLLLKDLLARRPDTRVLMTRERDTFVELGDRTKFANSMDADLFISIHVNAHPHKGVRGLEIYHFGEAKDQRALEVAARENGTPLSSTGVGWEYLVADLLTSKKIENSLELAWTAKQAMISGLNGRYSTIDHGVKTAPFYVLRFTTMPGILAEVAFMSNPIEEKQLRSSAYLLHVAEAMSDGIKSYLQPSRLTAR